MFLDRGAIAPSCVIPVVLLLFMSVHSIIIGVLLHI